jgi:hypothetical protein
MFLLYFGKMAIYFLNKGIFPGKDPLQAAKQQKKGSPKKDPELIVVMDLFFNCSDRNFINRVCFSVMTGNAGYLQFCIQLLCILYIEEILIDLCLHPHHVARDPFVFKTVIGKIKTAGGLIAHMTEITFHSQ